MASLHDFKALNAAIDTTPIIDNHAHPLLKPERLSKYPLLTVATEAHGDALHDSWSSLAHIRATKQLAQILGCEPTWEAVEASIEQQRLKSPDAWTKRCLEGIETLLLDDGLDGNDEIQGYEWHDSFVTSKCKRIVRIEAVATAIIQRHVNGNSRINGDGLLEDVMQEFREEIERSIADPIVVGFKSIICYRGGLDIPRMEKIDIAGPTEAIKAILEEKRAGKDFRRLQCLPLNHLFVHMTAHLIKDSRALHKKAIQFHTGLGDNDITLTKASPAHLQTFIRQYPTVPIVILHASYPWTREAGYLAAMYSNVYADIGEVFPFISRDGQEGVVKQILELCPWSKILWSTDGHWFPETYVLATTQIREVLKTVIGDFVRKGDIDEGQAVRLVQDILFTNSKKLYNLQLDTSLSTPLELTTPSTESGQSSTPWTNQAVIEKLRSLNVKWLRVNWHDYTSSTRGKLTPVKRVIAILESGKPFAVSVTKACWGLLQMDMGIEGSTSTGMYAAHPDWSSLKLGPTDGHASCFADFRESDGSIVALDPRDILRKTVANAAAQGLTFLLGFEIEFIVMERNPDASSVDKFLPLQADEGHAWAMSRSLADWGREGSFVTAVDEIVDNLEAAGIDIEQFHAESAPGQYELVLPPSTPLEACDTLLHTRQVIESVAARRGFRVTLHPKPVPTACGSASHVHMSISSPGGNKPEIYESFYAGILKHFRAIIAFTYSNPASYERMVDSFWAGGRWVTWGTQNKETPLRKCEDSHWELKTIDGIANPYLAMAAILSAGTNGILSKEPLVWGDCELDPAKISDAEKKKLGISKMFPANLKEALEALREDDELVQILDPTFVGWYISSKTAELGILDPMTAEDRRRWVLEHY